MTMNSGDWVKIILAMSVLVVMLGLIINIIIHGKDWVYSEIGVTALAGIMGAIVGVLGNSISISYDNKEDDDSED